MTSLVKHYRPVEGGPVVCAKYFICYVTLKIVKSERSSYMSRSGYRNGLGGVHGLILCQSADTKHKTVSQCGCMTNEQPKTNHFMRSLNTIVEGFEECFVKIAPELLKIAVSKMP